MHVVCMVGAAHTLRSSSVNVLLAAGVDVEAMDVVGWEPTLIRGDSSRCIRWGEGWPLA